MMDRPPAATPSPPAPPAPGNICRAGAPRLYLQRLGPSKPNAPQSRGLRLPPRSTVRGARSGYPRRERTEGGGCSGPVLGLSRLSCRVDLVTVPSALRNLFSKERTLRPPRLRMEGGEHRGSGPDPWSRAVAAAGRPLQAAVGSGGRGRGGGALPQPRWPPSGRESAGNRNPAPRSARLHLRIWGVPRVPFPSLPSWRSRRRGPIPGKGAGVQRKGHLPGEGRLPARAPLAGRPGEGAAALRRLRRQPSALHRRPARTSSSSRSAPPLGRAPRSPAAPRPAPPGAGLRASSPRAADLGSLLPSARASTVGRSGRKRKRLSTWTCLWRVAKQSSQITAPGGKKLPKKKKKNPCYCFRRHITFLHFPGSSGLAFFRT